MDKLSELDFIIGGVGFVSGLVLASIFGGNKDGCGCGPKAAPQFSTPPTDPLAVAKQIGPGVTQAAQTMGQFSGPGTMGSVEGGGCRRWKTWQTNDYGIPQQYSMMTCDDGTYVNYNGTWYHT